MLIKFRLLPPMGAPREAEDGVVVIDHASILYWGSNGIATKERKCTLVLTKTIGGMFCCAETVEEVTDLMLQTQRKTNLGTPALGVTEPLFVPSCHPPTKSKVAIVQ